MTNTVLEEAPVDQEKMAQAVARLRAQQSMPTALIAGGIAALAGALGWAAITLATNYQIGWMAVGVGVLVGLAVRQGKGIEKRFGVAGAILALAGCLLGNFFVIVGLLSEGLGIGYLEALQTVDFAEVPNVMIESGSPIDLLFFAIALHQGYRISFRNLSESEVAELAN
jgi:hypothetical protein